MNLDEAVAVIEMIKTIPNENRNVGDRAALTILEELRRLYQVKENWTKSAFKAQNEIDKLKEEILSFKNKYVSEFIDSQERLPKEFEEMLYANLFDLYVSSEPLTKE